MNAPISAAVLQLRSNAPAPRVQPTVPPTARLLAAQFEHDGLLVDLYGSLDESGYLVEHVALWPSQHQQLKVDLGAWLAPTVLFQLSAWCNRRLPSTDELLLASQHEDRAERALWMRRVAEPP
ncbi:hypothetical protein [Duganella callida]|uniref:Uncharacterized protein n=1 Tax=Duganella callida TaxID=2561932 RepID=A0A4Y9S345_9BURK|nr:hypothetical protein [Duganella callida]TFW15925.1 hypothetical protein E4L98_24830 [Duganella callida]